jgi:hypothetical protein
VYQEEVREFLTEGAQTQFSSLLQEFHLIASLSYKVKRMPRFLWSQTHDVVTMDGYPIAMTDFAQFPQNMLNEAEHCLQVVLQGLTFPDFEKIISGSVGEDPTHWIKDDLCNRSPGYSFVSDPRNPFQPFTQRLLRAIMDTENNPEVARRFFLQGQDGKVQFKRGIFYLYLFCLLCSFMTT